MLWHGSFLCAIIGTAFNYARTNVAGTHQRRERTNVAGTHQRRERTNVAGTHQRRERTNVAGTHQRRKCTNVAGTHQRRGRTNIAGTIPCAPHSWYMVVSSTLKNEASVHHFRGASPTLLHAGVHHIMCHLRGASHRFYLQSDVPVSWAFSGLLLSPLMYHESGAYLSCDHAF